MLTPQEQLPIICKGVETLVHQEALLDKLKEAYQSGRPLVIKLGLDPSAPDIHLGHAVVLRKIKQMQDLGHRAIIVIGDFTGKIGDPTGKAKGRIPLTEEQVQHNAETYRQQIFKVLDPEQTEVRFNSQWLAKLQFEEIIRLAASTTVARMLERDDFQKRYVNQTPIGLHEFFYPLMQAYDSVELEADIELGGTDQTFNILMGRTLQKTMGKKAQIAMFMPLLEGLDGVEKMSKSLGNYIGVNEPATVMFKKVMEIPDKLILKYYTLATDEHPDRIAEIAQQLQQGENPRNIKYQLAQIITGLYHGPQAVIDAEVYYAAAFQQKSIPGQIPQLRLSDDASSLWSVAPQLIQLGLLQSKSELLRLLQQKGVSLNGQPLKEADRDQPLSSGDVLRIGKKRFLRFV